MSKPKVPQTPPDPDPAPIAAVDSSAEVQGAARQAKKSASRNYGRSQTILAGNSSTDNAAKKTILGG